MFRRRRPVENRIVARRMGEFFAKLSADDRRDPAAVAVAYGPYRELGVRYILDLHPPKPVPRPMFGDWKDAVGLYYVDSTARAEERRRNNVTQTFGMHCSDVKGLGRWILDAEPLLTAGILRADIPFIDGVSLRDFGRITVEEFDAYTAFRDFMRLRLLSIDSALDEVRSERALATVGLEIADGFRSVRADLERARRKRAVAATGAVLGSVSAVLVAVYGPALAAAVAAIGAGGGLWGVVSAMADDSTRQLRENKWYYVWALSRKADI